MFFEYDVEEELLQKNREIEKLEQQVEQCQAEIRRLRWFVGNMKKNCNQ